MKVRLDGDVGGDRDALPVASRAPPTYSMYPLYDPAKRVLELYRVVKKAAGSRPRLPGRVTAWAALLHRLLLEVDSGQDPRAYAADQPSDALVFTPRVDDADPCARFHHPIR